MLFGCLALQGQVTSCRAIPSFLGDIGFDKSRTYLSTSEKHVIGIQAVLASKPGDETSNILDTYQHESWTQAGYLGALATDKHGDIYVIPTPKITNNLNPLDKQNIIYKIDGVTSVMEPYISLPTKTMDNHNNPYGLLGLTYDCYSEHIIVSSIMGSDEKNEVGQVYKVNLRNNTWTLIVDSIDVFGLSIQYVDDKKYLYLGKARTQDLIMFEIDNMCDIISPPQVVLNIAAIGPRGDDKIKKIKFYDSKTMVINITPFYYNLAAPSEDNQTEVRLKYFADKWNIVRII